MEDSNKKFLVLGLVAAAFIVAIVGIVVRPGRGVGYQPEQPIPFSHALHAGQRKIDCKYCHTNVDRAAHSNVPSVNVCMNCHKYVKTDSPHIKKLTEAYEQNKPVQWVNVHVLPDFAYFNHERHIARGVPCETCHGEVQEMEEVHQVAPLTMGWCVNCHRQQDPPAPIDCNTCHR